jgi:hypothetical protein
MYGGEERTRKKKKTSRNTAKNNAGEDGSARRDDSSNGELPLRRDTVAPGDVVDPHLFFVRQYGYDFKPDLSNQFLCLKLG